MKLSEIGGPGRFVWVQSGGLPRDVDWTLTSERIAEVVARLERERAQHGRR